VTPVYRDEFLEVYGGDARAVLAELAPDSIDCVVTSPPYWGLRDYGLPPAAWGGDPDHAHAWGPRAHRGGPAGRQGASGDRATRGNVEELAMRGADAGAWCECGAWCGQLGLEPHPDQYVAHLVEVLRAVRRVLRPMGTLWLNLGDSYATGAGAVGARPGGGAQGDRWAGTPELRHRDARRRDHGRPATNGRGEGQPTPAGIGPMTQPNRMPIAGLKPKDLVGAPWAVAFAARADGWYLRSDIVWAKPNPMPESVGDRPTRSHEYVFLLTKSRRYYYDAEAIREARPESELERQARGYRNIDSVKNDPAARPPGSAPHSGIHRAVRGERAAKVPQGWDDRPGSHGTIHREGRATETRYSDGQWPRGWASGAERGHDPQVGRYAPPDGAGAEIVAGRNRRSVWTVATEPYPGAHFATFPRKLIEPMILAGAPKGGIVLDPFAGSGTVGLVAQSLGRRAILVDLNPSYVRQALRRAARTFGVGGRDLEAQSDEAGWPAGSLWHPDGATIAAEGPE